MSFLYQTSLRELTTLGIKNAESLAIPSVRNDVSYVLLFPLRGPLLRLQCMLMELVLMQAAFLFTVVGTTGFLAVIAGQLPGVNLQKLIFVSIVFVS